MSIEQIDNVLDVLVSNYKLNAAEVSRLVRRTVPTRSKYRRVTTEGTEVPISRIAPKSKRVHSPYILFTMDQRKTLTGHTPVETIRHLARLWKEADEATKMKYVEASKALREAGKV